MRGTSWVGCLMLATITFGTGYAQQSTTPPKPPQLMSVDVFVASAEWLLPEGQWISAKMPMTLVHPRPDEETKSWARHRKAYPGLEYRIPIAVQGGAYPFYFEILEAPAWLSIGATVWEQDYAILRGIPPIGEDGAPAQTVRIRVYNQEHGRVTAETVGPTYVDVDFEIRVTSSTDDFIFIDALATASGDGSIGSPLRSLAAIIDGDAPSTYPGRAIYFREGYYYTTDFWGAYWKGEGNTGSLSYDHSYPHSWLAYPGESPVVSFERAKLQNADNFFVGGMKLHHTSQRALGYRSPDTWASPSRFFSHTSGQGYVTLFENEMAYGKTSWMDRMFDLEYVSPTQFKVLGYDAAQSQVYSVSVDGGNANGGNRLRFYDYVSPLTEPDTHVSESAVSTSIFDGVDTLVTMSDAVVPRNLQQVRQRSSAGNDGFYYTPNWSSNRPYLTVWGNYFLDHRTNAIGSLYANKYIVIEHNEFAPDSAGGAPQEKAVFFKSSNDFVSVRRNVALGSDRADVNGAAVFHNYSGDSYENTQLRVEFAYNLIEVPGDYGVLAIGTSSSYTATVEFPHLDWVYRNTFIGGVKTRDYQPHTIEYKNNLFFTDRASPYDGHRWTTADGDVLRPLSDVTVYFDASFQLKDEYRKQYLGTHGHEISR